MSGFTPSTTTTSRRRFAVSLTAAAAALMVAYAPRPAAGARAAAKGGATKPAPTKATKANKAAPARPTAAKPAAAAALPKPPPLPPGMTPYTESIPDSLVKFDMVPAPAPPGGKPFWIAKTETTWEPFDIYAYRLDLTDEQKTAGVDAKSRPSTPYGAPDFGFGHQGYAVLAVTYLSAQKYCEWLSAKTGKTYRLPTETEWEWAARAGGKSGPLPPGELKKVAWFWDNSEDKTQPVAKKAPNAWGLHDMLGNAGEWASRVGAEGGVLCGGSWKDEAKDVHSGARQLQQPFWNQTDPQNPKSRWWLADGKFVGFRVVREAD